MHNVSSRAIDQLNSFLRGEIASVETYRQALEKIHDSEIASELRTIMRSHQERCELLRTRVGELGGRPAEGSGTWGAFARLVQGGAQTFGVGLALSALHQGEDHGLEDYRRDLINLDLESADLVRSRVLPEQERTLQAITRLQQLTPA